MTAPRLQRELKKKQPFDSPTQEVYINLIRSAAVLSGEFTAFFKAYGLSESTYNVLRILRGARNTEDLPGLPSLEVADRLVTRVPDITRLVNRLAKAGLAERVRDTSDRRIVFVKITDAGLDLLAKIDQPLLEMHDKHLSHLSAQELEELSHLLEKARAALYPDA